MIMISKSQGVCGNCGAIFEVDWDPDMLSSYERNMGIESEYCDEEEVICKNCGNHIGARLSFWEYPVGVLSICNDIEVSETKNDNMHPTIIEKPSIAFYDL